MMKRILSGLSSFCKCRKVCSARVVSNTFFFLLTSGKDRDSGDVLLTVEAKVISADDDMQDRRDGET